MTLPNSRLIFLIVFLGCVGMMATALFMEHMLKLEPCSLCIFQRLMVISTGFIALIAAIHGPETLGIKIYGGLMTASAATGAGLAGRQLYLQALPADEVPACGASLDYLLDVFPLGEVLSMVLSGDGACAEVAWSLFGLSIPGWLIIAFFGLMAIGFWQIFRPKLS